jgi:VanZ family protein
MSIIPRSTSSFYLIFSWLSILIVTILLVLPNDSFPEVKGFVDLDKVIHIIIFAGLMFNFYMWKPRYKIHFLIGGIVYGILMEFIQEYWCVNRSFAVADMVADAIGAVLGLWIANLCLRSEKK